MKLLAGAATVILLIALASCKDASFYGTLGDKVVPKPTAPLVIAPPIATLAPGSTLVFSATGGTPPYAFSIASGPMANTVGSSTGLFTANAAGTVGVQVTDSKGLTSQATVTVTLTGVLAINPSTANVNSSSSIQFVAAGGTPSPSYTFSFTQNQSGATLNGATGLYTSGSGTGTDIIKVSDGTATTPPTATVTVSPLVTNVDYIVQSVANPGTAVGGTPLIGSAGFSFVVKNTGAAAGNKPVKWWAYLSDSATLNAAGMLLLDSDTTGAAPLASGASSAAISLLGTWPTVPVPAGATKYLVVQIAADDDLNSANNLAGTATSVITSLPVIISPPDIDYTETSITNTGAIVAGGPLAGNFVLKNVGTAAGTTPVQWTAYVSTDSSAAIVGADKVIDSNTTAALAANTPSASIAFTGTWPTTSGVYYFKVAASSPEDVNSANNVIVSSPVTTTFVDYAPSAVVSSGGLLAPGPLAGSFTLTNIGTASGSQAVTWVAWASANSVLDAGDTPVASGSHAGLGSSGSVSVPFTGTWPTPVGTEYLIVSVTAADDTVSGNNVAVSGSSYLTTPPNVDYSFNSLANTGAMVSGGPLTGNFVLHNGGSDPGTQTVHWTAYVSTDSSAAIVGADKVIDSNTAAALPATGNSGSINFSGTWPTPAPGPYYLKVAVSATDDINAANNVRVGGPFTTTQVDYAPSVVANTGALLAPGPMSGSFTLTNVGGAAGTQTVTWVAWASADTTLDASDTPVASGTHAALGASSFSSIPFTGTWPTPAGTEYLIVSVTAADDAVSGNNVAVSGASYLTTPPNVDYSFNSVGSTGGLVSGGPLTGNFVLHNGGGDPGTQAVHWTAYVSTDSSAAIVGADKVIDSNTTAALPAGGNSASINFSGTWPTPAPGPYYLKVAVSATDDINAANNVRVSGANTTTQVDYAPSAVVNTGSLAAPGPMSGSFTLTNVGGAAGTQTVTWVAWASANNVLDAGDTPVASGTHAALGASSFVSIPFAGTWPTPAGTEYLIVSVTAADDAVSGNNAAVSGSPYLTTAPNVDYSFNSVGSTGALVAGGPLTGNFVLHNGGGDPGTQAVHWTAYVSTDSTSAIVGADKVIDSNSTATLPPGGNSASINFSGTWPTPAPGPYYLKVAVSATDDINAANNVRVSAANTTTQVDYAPSVVTNSGALLAPGPMSGSFTLTNVGAAAGTQTVTWVAWASANNVLDAGDTPVASGTHAALGASSFVSIPFTGTWPTPAGTEYLIVSVTSADDAVSGNNVAPSASSYTTTAPNVDYRVSSVGSTGPIVAGGPLTGSFILHNYGSDAGTQPVHWTAYVSTDSTAAIVGADKVIDSNTTTALAAGTDSVVIPFSGAWPTPAPGPYYLKVAVSASDDINQANNVLPTGAYSTTQVDYAPSAVVNTGGVTAPGPLSGSFTLTNVGTANGTQTVTWSAWASTNNVLDAGDTLVATGTHTGLAPSGFVSIPFAGTWPAGTTQYLIVSVTSSDDAVSGNNVAVGPQYALSPPNVDYVATSIVSTGTQVAGSTLNGTLVLRNQGTSPGVQSVQWIVYVSLDSTSTIDAGAKVVDSGNIAPLAANTPSAPIPFAGTWPTAAGGPYYLKVFVSALDDANSANNVLRSVPYATTLVDYTVTGINNLGGTGAGQTLNANFVLQNIGNGNGAQPVSWTAYVSSNATLDGGDAVLASGTTGALGPLGSITIPFGVGPSVRWPVTAGSWTLIVSVSATDDLVPGNNVVVSVPFVTSPAQPDYTVSAVTVTAGNIPPVIPGGAVSYSFQVNNISAQNGTQSLSWTLYASLNPVVDGTAVPLGSGTTGPLLAGASTPITGSSSWPLHYGQYYLVASVSVAEDINSTNNSGATAGTTSVGIYSETEPNGDYSGLTNFNNFGVVNGVKLKPGMSILINASLPNPTNNNDKDDVFQYNTGSASSITFYMSWSTGPFDAGLFPISALGALQPGVTGLNTSSLGWVVISPGANTPLWIDVQDGVGSSYGKQNIGVYTLVISGN